MFLAFSGPAPGSSANFCVASLKAFAKPLERESVTLMSKSVESEHFICITDPDTVAESFVKTLLINECENIISSAGKNIKSSEITSYKKSLNIASKWIKNYTEFNFRSLGSYSISELDEIGSSEQSIN